MNKKLMLAMILFLVPFAHGKPYTCEYALSDSRFEVERYQCESGRTYDASFYYDGRTICFDTSPVTATGKLLIAYLTPNGESGCLTYGCMKIRVYKDVHGQVTQVHADGRAEANFSLTTFFTYRKCVKIRK
jgi:hypothetical protein